MKNIIICTKLIGILILVVFISTKTNAQPNPGPGNQGSTIGTTSDGPTVPFDGGMSLILISSGISYGLKKLKPSRK
jgi:hypothetical protein